MHYGTKRHSGRYPWGSGDNPYQHDGGFYSQVYDLKKSGLTEKQIAESFGISTTKLRARYSLAKDEFKAAQISRAIELKDRGYSNTKIGEMMNLPESTIRNYLNPTMTARVNQTKEIADILAKEVNKKKYLDIGSGVEYQLGISNTKLKTAVAMLEDQGYKKQFIQVEQATNPGKYTSTMVLTKDDVPYRTVWNNRDKIKSVLDVYSDDGGRTFRGIEKPNSIDSKRVQIRYKEDGGEAKDGLIEIRPGVADLNMGKNKYAQVRIAVDDTHYIKGMAVYNDDLPKGVDIIFNTNKEKSVPKLGSKDNTVLKPLKNDKDNPFESTVKQLHYTDKDGKEKLSAINIVNDDEEWGKWSKTLSSQMLSKQRPELVKQQLDLTYKNKELEFKEIQGVTNPAVKKRLLRSFADDCDSSAVHLKAAALPRQSSKVILPMNSLKENEIYAPSYRNGEEVILIRHPHAGTFEIPKLKVNNKNAEGKKFIGNDSQYAVGINHIVAQQLSGADFDGDTVLVIPTKNQNIKASRPIKELINFNPSERYKAYPGMPETSPKNGFHKQQEMGKISNLITDMTIKGAEPNGNEIIRAVKHSMVVIDAEKHNLNWKQSEQDNGIKELKAKYQGGANRGAATLISRAKSEARVNVRGNSYGEKDNYDIDPKTGEKLWTYKGETYTNKKGQVVNRTTKSTKMYEASDAFELSSGTPIETTYASYANKLKALGNEARKEYIATKPQSYSPSAAKTYKTEVDTLNAKLNLAKKHAPQERRAQLVTNKIVEVKIKDNPDLRDDRDALKKVRAQVLEEQRVRTGGKKERIEISPKEWEAIQAGAVSNSKLEAILSNTRLETVQELAVPRTKTGLTTSQIAKAKMYLSKGYTQAEAAEAIGVSVTTMMKAIG